AGRLGVRLRPGGQHPGVGSHNRLLQLGGGTYMELIAPDPDQPDPRTAQPPRARPFGLDQPASRAALAERPRLVHGVMRTRRLDEAVAAIDYDIGRIVPMTRGALAWRLCGRLDGSLPSPRGADGPPGGPPGGPASGPRSIQGVLPTLIDWQQSPHPTTTLEHRGVTLTGLTIGAPDTMLRSLRGIERDRRITLLPSETPMLGAELNTPRGWVLLE
ncbi:MAG TPA: VOC family protein, partial [Burkholderiaceae bacterium]|nr:VOC family protein [Burkholderiaceae bacterium]